MKEALKEAQKCFQTGEVPVGAILVLDDLILARGRNQREKSGDLLGHAEIVALRLAAKKLGDWRLSRCRVYITKEPCPMCAGALLSARISEVIFGAYDETFGAAGSVLNLLDYPGLGAQTLVRGGILQAECENLLRDFFQGQRNSDR